MKGIFVKHHHQYAREHPIKKLLRKANQRYNAEAFINRSKIVFNNPSLPKNNHQIFKNFFEKTGGMLWQCFSHEINNLMDFINLPIKNKVSYFF